MQKFGEDEYTRRNIEEQRRNELIKQEMEKYLALSYVTKTETKDSKEDDYIQPITPMTYKTPVKNETQNDLAKAQEVKAETKEIESHYNIVYFNPELKKPEVIETVQNLKFQSIEEKVVEESLGFRTNNVALNYMLSPLLKETLENVQKIEQKNITQIEKRAELEKIKVDPIKVSESLRKRDEVVVKIEEQLKNMEIAIKELNEAKTKKDIEEKVLPKLSPLTRKRFEALLKKGVGKKTLLMLLLAEDFFLTRLKFLLLSLNPKNIKGILKSIISSFLKK